MYWPYSRAKCPYCSTTVRLEKPNFSQRTEPNQDGDTRVVRFSPHAGTGLDLVASGCPECRHIIVTVHEINKDNSESVSKVSGRVIWPLSSGRPPVPAEVQTTSPTIAQDYEEACLVLPFSPKASAALSRRCLQVVLREKGNSTKKYLAEQIDEVLPNLPGYIAQNLEAMRQIGNFAAHEQKSKNTGAILDVEPGEAEWNLDILESLFDFYYVKPALEQKKRDEMNKKLAEANKPPLKTP